MRITTDGERGEGECIPVIMVCMSPRHLSRSAVVH